MDLISYHITYVPFAVIITEDKSHATKEFLYKIFLIMFSTIAIDCMGGDFAPRVIVDGVIATIKSGISDLFFLLYGDETLEECLKCIPSEYRKYFEVCLTKSVDLKNMKPSTAIRVARNSSMGMAIEAVKTHKASACISAGNTGAYMALAKILLKTIPGIDRPAIATLIPKKSGQIVMLDLGANADCTPKNLIDFSLLGEALAEIAFQKDNPKTSLLNIGAESIKGNLVVQETYKKLNEHKYLSNFVGFIEGDEIFNTDYDVVVTDGFSGNVALKVTEGTVKFLISQVKKAFKSNILTKLSYLLIKKAFVNNLWFLNPSNHNGALLLGLNGLVVKSHGGTDADGFKNAILFTRTVLKKDFVDQVAKKISEKQSLENSISEN